MTQVQWYLSCFGFSEAYVAVLFAGSDYREFHVQADKFWQESDLEKVESFLECLRTENATSLGTARNRQSWQSDSNTQT
jgi:hypothetical protein